MQSSGLYFHGSWKWQHIQLSINLGRYCTRADWKPHAGEMRRAQAGRSEQRERGIGGGEPTTVTDKSGNGKVERSERFYWLSSNKQNHMCATTYVCLCMHEEPQQHGECAQPSKGSPLTDQCMSLCIGLSPVIGGDGLFSFNYKLAVLVSEADVQIKKVRHARLILVNLPLHISPACQLLCDSNHHRHMPLLCARLCEPPLLCTGVVVFLPGLTCPWVVIFKMKQHHLSKKNDECSAGQGRTLDLLVYF